MYTIYVQKKPGFILEIWGNIENLDVKIDTKNVPRGNCLVIWSITKELSVLQEAKQCSLLVGQEYRQTRSQNKKNIPAMVRLNLEK